MKRKRFITILIAVVVIASISSDIAIPAGNNSRIPVFIGFKRTPGSSEQALVRSHGGAIKYSYKIVPAIAASVPVQALQGLANNPNVTYIEPDAIAYASVETLPWGVDKIDAEKVHTAGYTGSAVKVGVIDTGIDYTHSDLKTNYVDGIDYVNDDEDPFDDNGHGTHVAGTIAALWNGIGVIGVAPNASLYAIKVLDSGGSGSYSDIAAGLDWCAANGIDIVNMSLGGTFNSSTLETACDNAYNSGIILVAAAGNSGNRRGIGDRVEYPARYASVIAVAATDQSDKRASFSSTGPDVELSAPGVNVLSTYLNNSLAYGSGTSMASPHVAGTAALILSKNDSLTNEDVRFLLQETAYDLGTAGRDSLYGFGLVDAFAAVESAPTPGSGGGGGGGGEEIYMGVSNIVVAVKTAGKNVYANATITVTDEDGSSVSGATVSGHWSNATQDADLGTTDASGTIIFSSDKLRNPSGIIIFTFTVDNVTATGYVWDGKEVSDSTPPYSSNSSNKK